MRSRRAVPFLVRGAMFALLLAIAGGLLPGPGAPSAEAASLSQVKKLLASDPDGFGTSVSLSGDTVVVGADFTDDIVGAAYVFQRDQGGAGNWGEVKKLSASDGEAGDFFGLRVAVSGDVAVVGARFGALCCNFSGHAYLFERDLGGPNNWGEVKILTPSEANLGFGLGVAISGDTVLIGSALEVYVFQRDVGGPDNWGEVKSFTASDGEASDGFGFNLAFSGDTAVVGAQFEDAGGGDAGAAYVFERDLGGADNWGEVKKLTASDATGPAEFGISVGLSGDTAVVGAHQDWSPVPIAGAAYIYQRDEGGADNWGEVKKLTAGDQESIDRFGGGVAISGDTAVVGRSGARLGAAYIFERDEGGVNNWGEVKSITKGDPEHGLSFGPAVAVSSGATIVGARFDNEVATGAGAAYVFQESTPPPTPAPPPAPAVGGISVDPDLATLAVDTPDESGGYAGLLVGIAAAAAGITGLAGAAWYARRRWA